MQAGPPNVLPAKLIQVIQRGFTVAAALAKFAGNASSDPAHLYDMGFAATRADAHHFRFSGRATTGPLIEIGVDVL